MVSGLLLNFAPNPHERSSESVWLWEPMMVEHGQLSHESLLTEAAALCTLVLPAALTQNVQA